MLRLLTLLLAIGATIAIFLTTRPGRALLERIGLRDRVPGAASSEDVAFLLSACGGDRSEVRARLDRERDRFPELSEAEHYRRAIRRVFLEREQRSP
ncbi:MAG: hypothetical protein KC616_07690 [Myxococcales bacterium]|nr:hypothetical protein [Myxococcales bacterium]